MMATVGSIWAIGFVAYVFIYQNFSDTDNLPAQVEKIKVHIDQGEKGYWEDQRQAAYARLGRYERVFEIYLAAGGVVFVSIVLSGAVIAFDRADLIWVTGAAFVLALAMLVIALSFEVWTSIRHVRRLRAKMRVRQ